MTEEVEHFDEPTDAAKRAARRRCAEFAVDSEEAAQFMRMLGLHPEQWKDSEPVTLPPPRFA